MSIALKQEANLERDTSQAIDLHRLQIIEAMVTQHFAQHPELDQNSGERGRLKYRQDANYCLDYLSESLAVAQPRLFADYLAWAKVMLAGRSVSVDDLEHKLVCLCDALRRIITAPLADIAAQYIAAGQSQLATVPSTLPTLLNEEEPLALLARKYLAALLAGERQLASRLVLDAVESGVAVQDIYLQVFQPCQHEIGRLWQMSQISVAQEHYCTAATQLVMSQLYPYLFTGPRIGRTLVATCIDSDLHEIGVRMVSDIFELNGWDTFYLGANTPVASILEAVCEQKADVLAISVTITPHLKLVQELIEQVRATPNCSAIKILVGGYPFKVVPELWRQLGADGCARDAVTAVSLANSLVSGGASV